jgi:KH domain-containing protein
MKIFYIKSARKILQNKDALEKKLKVKISVSGTNIQISGNEVDEFFAERVLKALDFSFLIDEALLLANEDYIFEIINIKSYTHRKDLKVIKARIIGTEGKTLKVLMGLSNSYIAVKDNNVAVIAHCNDFENAVQAVVSIIQGSKQGNVYSYLEKAHKRD